MGSGRSIGLIYSYNENWIGGTYYVENVIKSLSYLPKEQQPTLLIYTNSPERYDVLKEKTAYNQMQSFNLVLSKSLFSRLKRKLAKIPSMSFLDNRPSGESIDFIFPNAGGFFFENIPQEKIIYWIPDFQELKLPEYFSEEEQARRIEKHKEVAATTNKTVFSSEAALQDYLHFYPEQLTQNYVIPFAVHTPGERFAEQEVVQVLKKYDVKTPFCIIPNQLWKHKNHQVAMEAVALLKKKGKFITVLNSGKEEDFRFPEHPDYLKKRAVDLEVEDLFRFLGFIPKRDLDILISAADVIVQPSFFEGWNTGVEEAKAQSKYILASDIDVHKEQLENYPNSRLFEVSNTQDLADQLEILFEEKPSIEVYDYQKDVVKFAESLNKLWS